MMRLMKLAGFLIFLAVSLLFAAGTEAALVGDYSLQAWNAYTQVTTSQFGSYDIYNQLEGYALPSGPVYVGVDPYPMYDLNGYSQTVRSFAGASWDSQYSLYSAWARSEFGLTSTIAQTINVSFAFYLNANINGGGTGVPSLIDPNIGIAEIYFKVNDTVYRTVTDNATNYGYVVGSIYVPSIALNPGDKLILGCYSFGGYDDWYFADGSDAQISNLRVTLDTPVPVPGGLWLLGSGLLGLVGWRKFRKT